MDRLICIDFMNCIGYNVVDRYFNDDNGIILNTEYIKPNPAGILCIKNFLEGRHLKLRSGEEEVCTDKADFMFSDPSCFGKEYNRVLCFIESDTSAPIAAMKNWWDIYIKPYKFNADVEFLTVRSVKTDLVCYLNSMGYFGKYLIYYVLKTTLDFNRFMVQGFMDCENPLFCNIAIVNSYNKLRIR